MVSKMYLTPQHVSCGIFIRYVLNRFQDRFFQDSPADEKQRLLICMLKLIKCSDMTWKEFQQTCINLHPSIFSACVKDIHQIVSLDELSQLFKSFEDLVLQKQAVKIVSNSSIVGLFLRKIVVSFKKLTYKETNDLLYMLQNYVNLKKYKYTSKPLSGESAVDVCVDEEDICKEEENIPLQPTEASSRDSITSLNQINIFMREQVELISSSQPPMNPVDLRKIVKSVTEQNANTKEISFLSLLNFVQLFDENCSANLLKKYFDYKDFESKSINNDLSDLEKHLLKFKQFCYSALNLAMMYCVLHHYGKAEMLLKEAIQISQATNDQQCLDQAMFWQKYIQMETKGYTATDKEATIEKLNTFLSLKERSQISDIEYLSFLQFIKEDIIKSVTPPSESFFTLLQICNPVSLLVSNYADLTYFALLKWFGLINGGFSLPFDLLANESNSISNLNEETKVLALLDVVVSHQFHSFYLESLEIISFCQSKLTIYSKYQSKLFLFKCYVEFEQHFLKRNMLVASKKMNSILLIDQDEGCYLSFLIELMNNNSTNVLNEINNFLKEKQELKIFPMDKEIKFLLLKIEILLLSKEPTQAIDDILAIITLTRRHLLLAYCISAKLYLIKVMLLLKQYKKAQRIIYDTFIETISFGSLMQQGVLFYLYASCLTEGKSSGNEAERKINLIDAISLLDKAFVCFQKGNMLAHMKNVYFKKAFIYDELNYVRERNQSSMQFRLLHEDIGHFPDVLLI